MPYGDRTGPAGAGPMTGRRLGYCSGYAQPGFATESGARFGLGRGPGFGQGLGLGRGRGGRLGHCAGAFEGAGRLGMGVGWRRAPFDYGVGADDPRLFSEPHGNGREILKRQADYLRKSLEAIDKRIAELGEEKASE